ncbi:amino acid ABC transporter permease [Flexilinea flocculi]|jgi:polar amino acid transport system substrate-binding protein|nr:amino acid ABC transporter permease [Flexilinea flocculi]
MMSEFISYLQKMIYTSLIFENRYQFLLEGLGMTLLITVLAFLLGTTAAVVICYGKIRGKRALKKFLSGMTQFFIRIPCLVLLMVFSYVIFADVPMSAVVVAVIVFSLKASSSMSDLFYTAIITVNPGEGEAARSLGLSRMQTFMHVIFPQAVKAALPLYKNQFIATLQETSIVGFLAIQDLTRASSIIASRTLDPLISLFIITVSYFLIGWTASFLLSFFEKEKHFTVEEAR